MKQALQPKNAASFTVPQVYLLSRGPLRLHAAGTKHKKEKIV